MVLHMRRMSMIGLLLLLSTESRSLTAASYQSVQAISGTLSVALPNSAPWTTIGAGRQPMRWEFRIHGFSPNNWPVQAILMPGGISPSQLYAVNIQGTNGNYIEDVITNNGPQIPNCCVGHSDMLIRVQRDTANNRYTFETFDVNSTYYSSATATIVTYGKPSWAGRSVQISAGVQIAFMRWFSGVVPLGTPIPNAGVTGDLADWEFEGNLADSSGHGLSLTGGTAAYVATPTYPPLCNAGSPQAFGIGHPATLDGTESAPMDGSGALTYLWEQVSGPPVDWVRGSDSTQTWPSPIINGVSPGSYTFQLTVTDGSGLSSQCTVNDGVVATDNNDVVITNNPAVDTLLGPMIRFGANPWPWFDNRHKAEADMQIAIMDQYYGAYWDVADPGTVAVTAGNATVTGSGTSFTTTFCQGPGASNTPIPGAAIVVWYPTNNPAVPGETGRRMASVASCQSNTQLTLNSAWTDAVAGGSGLSYADNARRSAWDYYEAPANYYDNVAAFYALYYRSGMVDYLNAARKLADRFWTGPEVDRGNSFVLDSHGEVSEYTWPARSASMMGMVLRALDGRPEMWAGLHKVWDSYGKIYIGNDPGSDQFDTLWGPGLWDVREVAYHLAMISYCALYDTDPGYQSKCQRWVSGAISGLFTQNRFADGGWHSLFTHYNSWGTPPTSATLTHGSTAVTGYGTSWIPSQFAVVSGEPSYMWFTNASSSRPASNAAGDPVYYNPAFVDGTHIILDRPYEGVTGTHGWAISTPSLDVPFLGYGALPYMEGILGVAFDFAAKAIAGSDPQNSALAHSYNVGAANWIRTYGYRAATDAVYYGAQFVNCQPPISEATLNPCTSGNSVSGARVLSAEVIRAVMAAYAYNQDPGLKSFADLLYNAMWAKPGTCPSGSVVCVPDGIYVDSYDDTGWYMTGTPPIGQAPKWFGDVWGFSGLSAWPAVRVGGLQSSSTVTVYVGFNLRGVQGAAKVRVTTTAPDGTVSQVKCSSSPCGVPAPGKASLVPAQR